MIVAASGSISGKAAVTVAVVATPQFSPIAGTYSSTQTVSISTTTPSATIYYTTNGSTPTTSSTISTPAPSQLRPRKLSNGHSRGYR